MQPLINGEPGPDECWEELAEHSLTSSDVPARKRAHEPHVPPEELFSRAGDAFARYRASGLADTGDTYLRKLEARANRYTITNSLGD